MSSHITHDIDNVKIRPGDVVKVVEETSSYSRGWTNVWTPGMSETVGQELTVLRRGAQNSGLYLVDRRSYPGFVLQVLRKDSIFITKNIATFPKLTFTSTGISCQGTFITVENVRRLCNKIQAIDSRVFESLNIKADYHDVRANMNEVIIGCGRAPKKTVVKVLKNYLAEVDSISDEHSNKEFLYWLNPVNWFK